MIGAGNLRERISIERNFPGADNDMGEAVENWSEFIGYRAMREDVRDSERLAAGQVSGSLMSRFVIRASNDSRTVDAKDRISYRGKIWQIHGVKWYKSDPRWIEITASTAID